MLHEPGHQSKPTIPSEASPAQSSANPLSSPMPSVQTYPAPQVVQPYPPKTYGQMPTAADMLRRPGCVTATALVFFIMAGLSCLSSMSALLLLDPLSLINNLGTMVIFTLTGLGLWAMYRWGANLVILFAVTTIIQFVMVYIFSAFLISDYITSGIGQAYMIFLCGGGVVMVAGILGFTWWWFGRTRRWFLPNDIFPQYERALYWFAVLMFGLGIIVSLVSLPDAFAQQRTEFDRFNRDIERIYRTPLPPEDNSPFGS